MIAPLWSSRALPKLLAADLRKSADAQWRRAMSNELVYGRHAGPARGDARPAAVAIVLCWDGAEWALPLTVRSSELTRHGGQVSLPGGHMDGDESPSDAALRELQEELGRRPPVEWLGVFEPMFVFASNAVVTPCIGAVETWPRWEPNPQEVDRVLKLEVRSLLQAEFGPRLEVSRGDLRFFAPQLIVEGHSTWGATATILGELRGRLLRMMGGTEEELKT